MSARFARSILASSARTRVNRLPIKRNMSVQSHAAAQKSDTPWVIGAALVFGPAFLYLLSPSARKSQSEHAIHNDHHDFPALRNETSSHSQVSEPVQVEMKHAEIMTDDEGTPADVTASIALSKESDVPRDSQSPETVAETTIAAEQAPVGEEAVQQVTTEEPANIEEAPVESASPEALAAPSTKPEV